jgi:hypothetical protein
VKLNRLSAVSLGCAVVAGCSTASKDIAATYVSRSAPAWSAPGDAHP